MDNPPTTDDSPSSPSPPDIDLTGRTLGDFHVLRKLGQGGMGQVYLAEQISLKRKVALKILRPEMASNPTALQRFKTEAEAVARVTHASIVQIYAINTTDGITYMALEYVEGRNLREFLARKGPPELPLAVSIMRQVAAALQRASEMGIVHRDIKPENILLTRKGEVKVADFGLSRCLASEQPALNLTQSGVTMGTPLYMSPEQVEGKTLDCRTDIYSFGVTCYHMLAGHPPYQGSNAFDVALQHVRATPPPLSGIRPDLPEVVCAIVHKMMARDPAQRYQTGRELLKDLARLRDGMSGTTTTTLAARNFSVELVAPPFSSPAVPVVEPARSGGASTMITPAPPSRRGWLVALFGLTIVLALMTGAAMAWMRRQASAQAPSNPQPDPKSEPSREQALRSLVDYYLNPDKDGPKGNLPLGLGACQELGLFYLSQKRLDDAETLFTRMMKTTQLPRFPYLGGVGKATVLGLRDRADTATRSNDLFREVLSQVPAKRDQEIVKLWQNAQFREYVVKALKANQKNGVPDANVLPRLIEFRDKTPNRPPVG
jgi:serine/threonine-protein kinase